MAVLRWTNPSKEDKKPKLEPAGMELVALQELPLAHSDPHLARFLRKLQAVSAARPAIA